MDNSVAWAILREAAGPDVSSYALTHNDGWSLGHLYQLAARRLADAYTWASTVESEAYVAGKRRFTS